MENKFKFFRGGDTLLVESDRLSETIDFIKNNNIKKIMLIKSQGFKDNNILFLKGIKDIIEEIEIIEEKIDLTGLEELNKLKKIFLRDELSQTIDFSKFSNLESCNLLWNKNIHGLTKCKRLKKLIVSKINLVDYNFFIGFENVLLESLDLTQGNVTNLDFLQYFPNLLELEMHYCPKLKDISGLKKCPNIRKLRFGHCKNIENFDFINQLKQLEYLGLSDNRSIPNIQFIKGLPLKHFTFVDTDIVDGDLTLCEGINYVAFNNKKHFTHKFIGMKEGIERKI